jgi:alkylation response protein AidB-like acyl-CoA dehydrogenase
MIEWSETDLLVRETIRGFVDKEIRPNIDALESGELPPYDIIRKLFAAFGLDVMAAEAVKKLLVPGKSGGGGGFGLGGQEGMVLIAISELAGVSLGLVASIGEPRADGVDHPRQGHARTETALAAGAGDLREGRGVGDHGAGFGLGRVRRDEVHGPARR